MTLANRNVKYKPAFTAYMAVAIGFSDTDESQFTVQIQTSTRLQHSTYNGFACASFESVSIDRPGPSPRVAVDVGGPIVEH